MYFFVRFFENFLIGFLVGFSLSHLPMETQWMLAFRGHNDTIYKSYMAMVVEYHNYNNPIANIFKDYLRILPFISLH